MSKVVNIYDQSSFTNALNTAIPGDEMIVAPGTYKGGMRGWYRAGVPESPIVLHAAKPGTVVIDASGFGIGLNFQYNQFWIIEGFLIKNASQKGLYVGSSPHMTVRYCECTDNGVWGALVGNSPDFLAEYNRFGRNKEQHGLYCSDYGNRPVIRYNEFFENGRAGCQINGGTGVTKNPVVIGNRFIANGQNYQAGAFNGLRTSGLVLDNNDFVDNLFNGIALAGCVGATVEDNSVAFSQGIGERCLVVAGGSVVEYARNVFTMGKPKDAVYQEDGSTATDGGDNIITLASGGAVTGTQV